MGYTSLHASSVQCYEILHDYAALSESAKRCLVALIWLRDNLGLKLLVNDPAIASSTITTANERLGVTKPQVEMNEKGEFFDQEEFDGMSWLNSIPFNFQFSSGALDFEK